ncbi:MAG: hypothetical protein ACE5E7_13805 [Anaerolineae bacterium]
MNPYQNLQQKALGLAFILGPTLMTVGAAAYLLGIGLTPFGTDSWVNGILGAFGFLFMIPVCFELGRILGQRAPLLGLICAAAGLGWGLNTIPAAARLMQMDIINAGLNESIWNVMGSSPGWTPILIGSLAGILAFLLLGVGFLLKGGLSRRTGGLLILAAVFFAIGIGGGADITWWQRSIFYPLACLAWLAALAPIGVRYLAGGSEVFESKMAAA